MAATAASPRFLKDPKRVYMIIPGLDMPRDLAAMSTAVPMPSVRMREMAATIPVLSQRMGALRPMTVYVTPGKSLC